MHPIDAQVRPSLLSRIDAQLCHKPIASTVTGGVKLIDGVIRTLVFGSGTLFFGTAALIPMSENRKHRIVEIRNSAASRLSPAIEEVMRGALEAIPLLGNYATKRIDTLKARENELLQQIRVLSDQQVPNAAEENKKLVEAMTQQGNNNEGLRYENSVLRERVRSDAANYQELENKVAALKTANESLIQEVSSSKDKLTIEQGRCKELELKYAELQSTLDKSLQSKDTSIQELQTVLGAVISPAGG